MSTISVVFQLQFFKIQIISLFHEIFAISVLFLGYLYEKVHCHLTGCNLYCFIVLCQTVTT